MRTLGKLDVFRWRGRCAAMLAAVFLAAFCAGCSSGGYTNSSSAQATANDSAEMVPEEEEVKTDEGAYGGAPQSVLQPPAQQLNRKIIWRVQMRMETTAFDETADAVSSSISQAGGYVESSSLHGKNLNAYGGMRYLEITARVPHDKLDSFLSAVSETGNVYSLDRQSEDITLQYADNEARKRSLQVEYDRLLALLEKADTVESIVELEKRISEVRYELDALSSALRKYDSLIDYSTVSIQIEEVTRVTEELPITVWDRISQGFSHSVRSVGTGLTDLMVSFIVSLPYLAILGAVIAIFFFVVRAILRRTGKKAKPTGRIQGREDDTSAPNLDNDYQFDGDTQDNPDKKS